MGPARVALPVRGLGLGPIERGRLSGGVADLQSECPFGAERGTEHAALRRTSLLCYLSALRRATSAWRASPVREANTGGQIGFLFLVATLPAR